MSLNQNPNDRSDLVADIDSLAYPRLRTINLTEAEIATLEGERFYVEIEDSFGPNETKYYLFDMPDDSEGYAIALQNRDFQPYEADARYQILWDASGFIADAASEVDSFNENKRSSKTGGMKVYQLSDGTSTEPTDDGTIRERGGAGKSGNAQNRSGAVDAGLSFRLYDNTNFIFKCINGSTDQDIHIGYTWFKIPLSVLGTIT